MVTEDHLVWNSEKTVKEILDLRKEGTGIQHYTVVNKDSFVNCIRYVIAIRQKSVAQAGLTVRKQEAEMSTGIFVGKILNNSQVWMRKRISKC